MLSVCTDWLQTKHLLSVYFIKEIESFVPSLHKVVKVWEN